MGAEEKPKHEEVGKQPTSSLGKIHALMLLPEEIGGGKRDSHHNPRRHSNERRDRREDQQRCGEDLHMIAIPWNYNHALNKNRAALEVYFETRRFILSH